MQILFIGDIFGSPGRKIVRDHLSHVVETNKVDLVIANAENAAGGFGLTPAIADEIFDLGCHVLTTGNHIWDKREIVDYFNSANGDPRGRARKVDRKSTRLNSSHQIISYAVFCLKKKKQRRRQLSRHRPSNTARKLHIEHQAC